MKNCSTCKHLGATDLHSPCSVCNDSIASPTNWVAKDADTAFNVAAFGRHFPSGAYRDSCEDKLDYEGFLSPKVLKRYAEYMHKNRKQSNGEMRDSDNWQQGIPQDVYMKSMWRHFFAVWEAHRNDSDPQEELSALLFNVMGYLHEELKK